MLFHLNVLNNADSFLATLSSLVVKFAMSCFSFWSEVCIVPLVANKSSNLPLPKPKSIASSDSEPFLKGLLNYKGDGTVAIRDSLNFSSVTDENTGIYELNITNNMGNNDYHLGAFHRSNSQTSGIAVEADLETGKVDDFKTFAGESTLIDREIAGGLIAGDLA